MAEIRFEADDKHVAILDGYCNANGKSRTSLVNALLKQWAENKEHEAIVICRMLGIKTPSSECARSDTGFNK